MRTIQWLGAGILGAGLVAGIVAYRWLDASAPAELARPAPTDFPDPLDPLAAQVEPRPVEKVPAGTVIGEAVPEGWTHLVIFFIPELSREDYQFLPKLLRPYCTKFKFVWLAQVEKKEQSYTLRKVAGGNVVEINGKDLVIDSTNTYDAELGLLGKRILVQRETAFAARVRQLVQTPTMVVIDDRDALLRQGKDFVFITIRSAILVDPRTGQVSRLSWLISQQEDKPVLLQPDMQLLPAGTRDRYHVVVRRDRFVRVFGLPEDDAFALDNITQGKAVQFTPELEKLAPLPEYTREQAIALEKALGSAVRE